MRFVVPAMLAASALSGAALAVRAGTLLVELHPQASAAVVASAQTNKRSSFMGNPPSTATGGCNGRSVAAFLPLGLFLRRESASLPSPTACARRKSAT